MLCFLTILPPVLIAIPIVFASWPGYKFGAFIPAPAITANTPKHAIPSFWGGKDAPGKEKTQPSGCVFSYAVHAGLIHP